MANSISKNKGLGIIAKAAAGLLADQLQFCKAVSKADETDYNGKNGYSAGDTIYINTPAKFTVGSSFDLTSSIQDIKENTVALPLDILSSVGVELNSVEIATEMQIKSLVERVIKPAVADIAADVESKMLTKAINGTYNLVGTAGSTTFDTATMLSARAKMSQFLAPKDNNRFALLNSNAATSAVNARKSLFQSSSEIAEQYKMGYMGQADGFTYLENELLPTVTNGNDVSGVTVNAAVSTGATTVALAGVTATTGTVKKGSVFTIAGIYAVHPQTKVSTGALQQFVVTADATANGSGVATVSVSPTIYGSASGSLQNVSGLPAGSEAVTFSGSASTGYVQNLCFHKNAFRMASVPLVLPEKAEFAAQETYQGVTVAIVRDFDVVKRRMITRLDFLGGLALERPEWACRVTA